MVSTLVVLGYFSSFYRFRGYFGNSSGFKSIVVILAEKRTSGASMPELVMPRHYICSRDPMERK